MADAGEEDVVYGAVYARQLELAAAEHGDESRATGVRLVAERAHVARVGEGCGAREGHRHGRRRITVERRRSNDHMCRVVPRPAGVVDREEPGRTGRTSRT